MAFEVEKPLYSYGAHPRLKLFIGLTGLIQVEGEYEAQR